MRKTMEQLELDIEREMKYSASLNLKIDALNERLKKFMPREAHEKAMALLTQQYENRLSEIKNSQSKTHNERGAGRKKKATNEVIARVLQLKSEGISQANIASTVSAEFGLAISRTTVGEIVRGKYTTTPQNVE